MPSFIFPVSPCQSFYLPMLCNIYLLNFRPVYISCFQSKSQSLSTSKFHSLSPTQCSGVSPSTLTFWSVPNYFRFLYNIYFLLLEHPLFSSSISSLSVHNQPAKAPHQRVKASTLLDSPDFFIGLNLFFSETTFIYSSSHLPILQA